MAAIVFLSLLDIMSPQKAFSGFISNALLMVGALFIVTAGLRETELWDLVGGRVLGPAKSEIGGLLMLTAASASLLRISEQYPNRCDAHPSRPVMVPKEPSSAIEAV